MTQKAEMEPLDLLALSKGRDGISPVVRVIVTTGGMNLPYKR
jgi:hypothetical protein